MPKQPSDQLVTQWIYQDYFQYKDRSPKASVTSKYAKALLDVAGADGVVTDAERKWVVGYAAIRGVSHDDLEVLKKYQIGSEDSTAIYNNDSKLKSAEHFQAELIYDGFRAAAADGTLKTREIDAISALAKKLGMTDEKFQEILTLYKEEEEHRQKRIEVLFPKSYADAVKAIDKHYGR
ncbi:unnamed protein product [Rotaria magnacalcarata]|uniref:Co-chaperone DjlA N-terminal domain-containing protein n=1 Tax=Rotaria magnacalcarata TaxID=392030 RepID=A0A816RYG1_9BILA|nr:unnamed protein product [Rotaria magnacalcarata]CAF2107765.1 unnamed protein product [Rotaria magnacalcarata]CAF3866432.1 unnamed protein product [Rotaria magnacalcarata]CAF4194419.1 unnamed protein product [Rotaria magnacalcarata]